jgi:hypothetical protein
MTSNYVIKESQLKQVLYKLNQRNIKIDFVGLYADTSNIIDITGYIKPLMILVEDSPPRDLLINNIMNTYGDTLIVIKDDDFGLLYSQYEQDGLFDK